MSEFEQYIQSLAPHCQEKKTHEELKSLFLFSYACREKPGAAPKKLTEHINHMGQNFLMYVLLQNKNKLLPTEYYEKLIKESNLSIYCKDSRDAFSCILTKNIKINKDILHYVIERSDLSKNYGGNLNHLIMFLAYEASQNYLPKTLDYVLKNTPDLNAKLGNGWSAQLYALKSMQEKSVSFKSEHIQILFENAYKNKNAWLLENDKILKTYSLSSAWQEVEIIFEKIQIQKNIIPPDKEKNTAKTKI